MLHVPEHQVDRPDWVGRDAAVLAELALIRRYGLRPYRYCGQRYTTVMVRAPRRFVEETLSPEFSEILATLRRHLDEITERVIAEVIHQDSSEADEVAEPRQLGFGAALDATPAPALPDHVHPCCGDPKLPPQAASFNGTSFGGSLRVLAPSWGWPGGPARGAS